MTAQQIAIDMRSRTSRPYVAGMFRLDEIGVHIFVQDSAPSCEARYWKVSGGVVVEMTAQEKADTDTAIARAERKASFYRGKRYRVEVPFQFIGHIIPNVIIALAQPDILTEILGEDGNRMSVSWFDNLDPDDAVAMAENPSIFTLYDFENE